MTSSQPQATQSEDELSSAELTEEAFLAARSIESIEINISEITLLVQAIQDRRLADSDFVWLYDQSIHVYHVNFHSEDARYKGGYIREDVGEFVVLHDRKRSCKEVGRYSALCNAQEHAEAVVRLTASSYLFIDANDKKRDLLPSDDQLVHLKNYCGIRLSEGEVGDDEGGRSGPDSTLHVAPASRPERLATQPVQRGVTAGGTSLHGR